MNGAFGVTYEQLQPKLSLSAGPSATKHGPNTFDGREDHERQPENVAHELWSIGPQVNKYQINPHLFL
jgi:hypothetical protein